ncbi:MAG: hypothetical protein WD054_05955, partial [Gemmatimonadota bacterium]
RLQISMNLENLELTPPMAVFARLEACLTEHGGEVEETEIIGMLPDQLVWGAAADRLRLSPDTAARLLSARLVDVMSRATDSRDA